MEAEPNFTDALAGVIGTQLKIPRTSSYRFVNMPYNISSGSGVKMVSHLVEIQKERKKQMEETEKGIDIFAEGKPTIYNQLPGMKTASLVNQISNMAIFGNEQ
jgi:hypothetical protein